MLVKEVVIYVVVVDYIRYWLGCKQGSELVWWKSVFRLIYGFLIIWNIVALEFFFCQGFPNILWLFFPKYMIWSTLLINLSGRVERSTEFVKALAHHFLRGWKRQGFLLVSNFLLWFAYWIVLFGTRTSNIAQFHRINHPCIPFYLFCLYIPKVFLHWCKFKIRWSFVLWVVLLKHMSLKFRHFDLSPLSTGIQFILWLLRLCWIKHPL